MVRKPASEGVVAENRRARRDYEILETLEVGLVLQGSEVKSLRVNRADLAQSYAAPRADALFLFNTDIPAYAHSYLRPHSPKAPRKLLLHKKELSRLFSAVQQKGLALIPLRLYFNDRGRAKLLLGLARGRKLYDKRAREKTKDWQKEKQRLLRQRSRQ